MLEIPTGVSGHVVEFQSIKLSQPWILHVDNFSVKIFFSHSLKRTTDVMFGGKQVVVCGYGEVSSWLIQQLFNV